MNGNLKVQSVSVDSFVLKQKRTYKNVNIHFRDEDNHTLKLSTDPTPLLEANSMEFNNLLNKKPSKNRWLTTGDHPIF